MFSECASRDSLPPRLSGRAWVEDKQMMNAATHKIFEALCTHIRARGTNATMTRRELQVKADLSEQELMDVLRQLRDTTSDLSVRFVDGDPDKITLGISWAQKCGGPK